ncbi:TPA: hypothetical protein HA244_05155 [Candidatus Micrarchaeota archaeon]|nr:hypothetical protein [Candidatus Micrarchaeota archaeon]
MVLRIAIANYGPMPGHFITELTAHLHRQGMAGVQVHPIPAEIPGAMQIKARKERGEKFQITNVKGRHRGTEQLPDETLEIVPFELVGKPPGDKAEQKIEADLIISVGNQFEGIQHQPKSGKLVWPDQWQTPFLADVLSRTPKLGFAPNVMQRDIECLVAYLKKNHAQQLK